MALTISEIYAAKLGPNIDLVIQIICEENNTPSYYIYSRSTVTNFEIHHENLLFKSDNVNTKVLELIDLIKQRGGSIVDEEHNIVGPDLCTNTTEIYDIMNNSSLGEINMQTLVTSEHQLRYTDLIDSILEKNDL